MEGISQTFLALPLCNPVNVSYLVKFSFPGQCKIPKQKPLFKKGFFSDQKNQGSSVCHLLYLRKWKKRYKFRYNNIWLKMAYYLNINEVFAQIFQPILAFDTLRGWYFEKNGQRMILVWSKKGFSCTRLRGAVTKYGIY